MVDINLNPFQGNLTYLMTAVGITAGTALNMFRYQSAASYYTNSANVIGSTNYYELANMLGNYGAIAIGGSLALL